MTSGKFIDERHLENIISDGGISCKTTQIVLGSETGALYLVTNFEVSSNDRTVFEIVGKDIIYLWAMPLNIKMYVLQVYQDEIANLQLPLTKLETLPSVDPKKSDSLLCVGNFNALAVIRDGKVRKSTIKAIFHAW